MAKLNEGPRCPRAFRFSGFHGCGAIRFAQTLPGAIALDRKTAADQVRARWRAAAIQAVIDPARRPAIGLVNRLRHAELNKIYAPQNHQDCSLPAQRQG
jgi:hypothetical protein